MNDSKSQIRKQFNDSRCCVIIPTYNNIRTICPVIESVTKYTHNIIVVNDGSTDGTGDALRKIKNADIIGYSGNRGKGFALCYAFKYAASKGYKYAVTIDSDGQHIADDLPSFMNALKEHPESVIIGSRNMDQEGVPRKSSFGNKFSNFWFKFETGKNLPDTQSGYRLYPLEKITGRKYFTKRFEFEIEVLVRAAWRGVEIFPIPVHVIYQSGDDRVTHFRPVRDFSRISVINTIFVIWALLYEKPKKFLLSMTPSGIIRHLKKNVFHRNDPDHIVAFSVALGLFMGIAPVWGYQMLIALILASILRLNKVIVIAAANISIPPMIPFIIYLSFLSGSIVTGNDSSVVVFSSDVNLSMIKNNIIQYVYGSVILGFFAAFCGFVVTFSLLKIFNKKK